MLPNITNFFTNIFAKQSNNRAKIAQLKKQVAQGFATAQTELGTLYFKSEVTVLNMQAAFYWYQKAAEQNHAEAQYNLGVMFYRGLGTSKDIAKVQYWLGLPPSKAIKKPYPI